MQARFYITERDYVRAGAVFARPTRRFWGALALFVVLGLGLAVWGPHHLRAAVVGGVAGGLIGGAVVRFGVQPWLLRRHYRQYKAIQQEQVVTLRDDGVHFTSADGEARLGWDRILKWRHSPDYVLIYPMPRLYYLVPSTVAAQGFDLERLKDALARHVGPAV